LNDPHTRDVSKAIGYKAKATTLPARPGQGHGHSIESQGQGIAYKSS